MGELINRFKTDSKFSVNTKTQEEYDLLMQWCEKEGIKWRGGANATRGSVWSVEKEITTISAFYFYQLELTYSNVDYDRRGGGVVIPFSDFAKEIMPDYKSAAEEAEAEKFAKELVSKELTIEEFVALCARFNNFSCAQKSFLDKFSFQQKEFLQRALRG